jgi:hypothetical protein
MAIEKWPLSSGSPGWLLCYEQGCAASKAVLEPELWQLMLFGGRISMRMGGDE